MLFVLLKHRETSFKSVRDCMLCHKQDFSFLRACHHISKYLTLTPYPLHRSHKHTCGDGNGEVSSLHECSAWLHDCNCGSERLGSESCLFGKSTHTHNFWGLSVIPSQDQATVMHHRLPVHELMAYSTEQGKHLMQCLFWPTRRVRPSTKRHLHRLNQKQSTISYISTLHTPNHG